MSDPKTETRNQLTNIEKFILSDLSGERALHLAGEFTAQGELWSSLNFETDPALAQRGQSAFESAQLILRKLWETAHSRPLK